MVALSEQTPAARFRKSLHKAGGHGWQMRYREGNADATRSQRLFLIALEETPDVDAVMVERDAHRFPIAAAPLRGHEW
jgi:hypothetical protein